MIEREMTAKLLELSEQYPIVSITGPRQSGKSTLAKSSFPDYEYLSFENPDVRSSFEDDPVTFLRRHGSHVIFDEAQRVPELFSYLQGVVDESGQLGQFVITGSQNFLLMKSVSQSLAGRVALFTLLPLSQFELAASGKLPSTLQEWLFRGGYPRLYDAVRDPRDFFPDYVQTYLERDVRAELGVRNLAGFQSFLQLCALRCGELLNVSSLAADCGISPTTAREWLSILQASHIVFLLRPYYSNRTKRLVKSPKLYFHDTGLAAHLIGLESADDLYEDEATGRLFECAVVAEVSKRLYARKRTPRLSFWRDDHKQEIDLLIERGRDVARAVECKSSATYRSRYFETLNRIAGERLELDAKRQAVVYGGAECLSTRMGELVAWAEIGRLLS